MRLWSLHPSLLDRQGLIACWREALLAQAVVLGRTRGYTRHPQLERFRIHPEPVRALGAYLVGLHEESLRRGYRFDAGRIDSPSSSPPSSASWSEQDDAELDDGPDAVTRIRVTTGQLELEWSHLLAKLAVRSPEVHAQAVTGPGPSAHPLFTVVPGDVEPWERAV